MGNRPRILPRQIIRTRDEVDLCADVYLPEGDQPRPAVLIPTPYGRTLPFLLKTAVRISQAGFCAILQDTRGRYQSGGRYDWRAEHGDGVDSLSWLGAQPWCDGNVGLMGMSMSAHPNFLVAGAPPPEGVNVRVMVNIMGALEYYSMFYRNGALVLHWALPWCALIGARGVGRNSWQARPWSTLFRHMPMNAVPEDDHSDLSLFRTVVSWPADGGFWEEVNALHALRKARVPTLHLTGWHDFMLDQTLMAYQAMAAANGQDAPQKLVVGPWDHQSLFSSFGAADPTGGPDLLELVLAWLDRWLPADPVPEAAARMDQEPPVLLYMLKADRWLGLDAFPPAEGVGMDWYLGSNGRANTWAGDGRLGPKCPDHLGQDGFVFDPENPVPTIGGAIWPFPAADLKPGPADQSSVEQRPDVLVYTSEPIDRDTYVIGRLTLELWAATSAQDTDFTAKLVDVDLQGVPLLIQDGIVRGRFHSSLKEEARLEPNRPYRFEIDLQATAYCLRRGHRLRLEVSSSNFPKFDRNLNTAAPLYTATTPMVAQQAVFHGPEMPSRLRIVVVPSEVFAARILVNRGGSVPAAAVK